MGFTGLAVLTGISALCGYIYRPPSEIAKSEDWGIMLILILIGSVGAFPSDDEYSPPTPGMGFKEYYFKQCAVAGAVLIGVGIGKLVRLARDRFF